jgi:2-keto-4-pentenoate hydratase/2-oxohepta-3-ene-1,7-dioic acid hydratase in catechol pathway
MKLLRYGPKGQEKTGVLLADGTIRDLSAQVPVLAGDAVAIDALAALKSLDLRALPVVPDNPRIGQALAFVPNFHCIGLNYARHAAETGARPPAEPVLFTKASTAVTGPFDQVRIPPGSTTTDWEVELGVVIGRRTYRVSVDEALSCVAGYLTINDVSERTYQRDRGGQWVKGKSSPTFGPIGPWLVTADEVPDPQALRLWLNVNGHKRQDSNTADMIFTVAQCISAVSEFLELAPGDVISTGTPEGVGLGMKPPVFLAAGDVIELEVEGLGRQRQEVVQG